MSYSINPAAYGSMFAVPSQVVDNYIKLASPVQLKVLLWVFRHASEKIDVDAITKSIGYTKADVNDALVALCEWSVLVSDSGDISVIPEPEKVEKKSEAKKVLPDIQPIKPSYEQIIKRCKESPQIKNMFTDIQKILGKTIGYDGQSVLIMMHDQYGLPFEVIYMLVDYCVSVGKGGFAYISKVGKDWGEKEIDTLEKADEQIKTLNSCNGLWKEFASMAGIQNPRPSATQSAYLLSWSKEMKYDVEMIYLAYEEMINHSSRISFPYMNKVLANWNSKGLRTPEDVEKDKAQFKSDNKSKNQKKNNDEDSASFDMNEFRNRAEKLPVYKKGE